jgi:hypothetical protein
MRRMAAQPSTNAADCKNYQATTQPAVVDTAASMMGRFRPHKAGVSGQVSGPRWPEFFYPVVPMDD